MAAGQKRIEKILREGLTGWEAGKLLIEDSWEVDHGREGFLGSGDIQRIKNSLTEERDIKVYNSLIETYRLVDFSLKEAHIASLEAVNALGFATRWLHKSFLDTYVFVRKTDLPVIMTEKQYQEQWPAIKERQRQRLLEEPYALLSVIQDRAWEQASEEQKEEIAEPEFVWRYPEVISEAARQIQELIRAGKLRPVSYLQEDRERLQELEEQLRPLRERKWPPTETREELEERVLGLIQPLDPEKASDSALGQYIRIEHRPGARETTVPDWTAQDEAEFESLLDKKWELQEEAFQRGKESEQQIDEILEGLGRMIAEPEDREIRALLSGVYCSGEDLYQAGLPEQIRWIDEYKANCFEGDLRAEQIAIIRDPDPRHLDERGYYDLDYLDWLEDLTNVKSLDESLRDNRGLGGGLSEVLQRMIDKASHYITLFLSFQAVITTVSEVLEIDLTEDLKAWHRDITGSLDEYNGLVTGLPHFLTSRRDLPVLRLSAYEPDPEQVQYLKERMAISLGEDWWEEVSETVLAREGGADE